jgi:hypothetical protein
MEYPPGWTCEKTVVQFELYFVGRLKLADALAVAEHLEACPGCVEQLVLIRVTQDRHTHA